MPNSHNRTAEPGISEESTRTHCLWQLSHILGPNGLHPHDLSLHEAAAVVEVLHPPYRRITGRSCLPAKRGHYFAALRQFLTDMPLNCLSTAELANLVAALIPAHSRLIAAHGLLDRPLRADDRPILRLVLSGALADTQPAP